MFSRARGAQLSVVLGTQELADLEAVLGAVSAGGIRDRILGNLDVLVSHRQVVPDSAELVAAIAGTHGAWITTHQTGNGIGVIRTGLGSRTRGREYRIHPDEIKRLGVGEAALIVPGSKSRRSLGSSTHRCFSRRTPVLTNRDRETVRWIGRHGAVQAQHVMTRFSIGRTASYRRLHQLVEFGLIRRHRLLYNDAGLLTATPDGLRGRTCTG